MLTDEEFIKSKKTVLKLKKVGQCQPYFKVFHSFIMMEEIQLNMENVMPLLLLADKYCVEV